MDTIVRLKFPPEPKQINQTIELTNEQARKPEEPKQINQTIERTNEQPRKPEEQWLLTDADGTTIRHLYLFNSKLFLINNRFM